MNLTPYRLSLVIAAALAVGASSARAQIDVRASALPTVGVAISGPLGGGAAGIINSDLRRTSEIAPAGAGSGEYVATGQATDGGITGQLVNKRGGSVMLNETFSGHGRLAAHEFADAIVKAITGLPGFATSKIAFIASAGGSKELYAADIDGFNTRAITSDHTISASPAINRDATKIAYTSYKSGYPDVYTVDLGTGSRTRIAFFPGINTGPAFSPDGSTRIVAVPVGVSSIVSAWRVSMPAAR